MKQKQDPFQVRQTMGRAYALVMSENPLMRNVLRLILQQEDRYQELSHVPCNDTLWPWRRTATSPGLASLRTGTRCS